MGTARQGLTSYVVTKKYKNREVGRFYYYKCRTAGCNCNKSAKKIHQSYADLLSSITLKPHLIPAVLHSMNPLSSLVALERQFSNQFVADLRRLANLAC